MAFTVATAPLFAGALSIDFFDYVENTNGQPSIPSPFMDKVRRAHAPPRLLGRSYDRSEQPWIPND